MAPVPPTPPVVLPCGCGSVTPVTPPVVPPVTPVTPPVKPPVLPIVKPGVNPTTGIMTVVGAGETVLAFTGVGGLTMLLPGAALLLILGMVLLMLTRRETETETE